eukprot:gene5961-6564_t
MNSDHELRIASCSYEGSLFGWDLIPSNDDESPPFNLHFHFGFNVTTNSSLRAIAISKSGHYLATAGMNERISLFDMNENKALGEVSGHTGKITTLSFYEDSILMSASEDGTMFIWRVYDWEHLHILGGHKDIIHDFAIHPSGKLALSVSKDHTMKLWNLIQGRLAFTRRLRLPADLVRWHPEGSDYLLCAGREVQIFHASDNQLRGNATVSARINGAAFLCLDHEKKEYGIVIIDEGHHLVLLTLEGEVKVSVDVSGLSMGRLRGLTVATISPSNSTNTSSTTKSSSESDFTSKRLKHFHQAVDVITVITSTGCVAVLDGTLLADYKAKDQSTVSTANEEKIDDKRRFLAVELFGDILLAWHETKAEPRLTAVTSWVPIKSSADKSSNKRKEIEASKVEEEEEIDEDLPAKKKVSFQPSAVPAQPSADTKPKGNNKKNKNKKNKH